MQVFRMDPAMRLPSHELALFRITLVSKRGASLIGPLSRTQALPFELTLPCSRRPESKDYLHLSCHMACSATQKPDWAESKSVLTDSGVWRRELDAPSKNGDGVDFKSALIRHLGTLLNVCQRLGAANETSVLVRKFLEINLESQDRGNTNGNCQYGPWWNGPYVDATSHSQLPVLDITAATRLVAGPRTAEPLLPLAHAKRGLTSAKPCCSSRLRRRPACVATNGRGDEARDPSSRWLHGHVLVMRATL